MAKICPTTKSVVSTNELKCYISALLLLFIYIVQPLCRPSITLNVVRSMNYISLERLTWFALVWLLVADCLAYWPLVRSLKLLVECNWVQWVDSSKFQQHSLQIPTIIEYLMRLSGRRLAVGADCTARARGVTSISWQLRVLLVNILSL